ncbi:MAG: hypothetical protein P1U65_15825 [Minwuia sp.]|nr:hypothetical protein [Minwuia sp.]
MTSYAYANRASLPGEASIVDSLQPSKQAFDAKEAEPAPARASEMVAKDHPHPAPHPSTGLAHDVDRTAFNERWQRETREARKAAFIVKRQQQPSVDHDRAPANDFNRKAVISR